MVVIFYCLSYGPVMYFTTLMFRNGYFPPKYHEAVRITFYPHFLMTYRYEWYFGYISWFAIKAGENAGSHESFRRNWAIRLGYPIDSDGNPLP